MHRISPQLVAGKVQPSCDQIVTLKPKNMGKLVGIAGTLRGKVGAMVFSKGENGQSYAKSYQPQVHNPRTVGQLRQRAKMNITGRISQVVSDSCILGLGGSKARNRRALFCANLLKVASIDESNPGVIASMVDPNDIVFSKGSLPLKCTVSTGLNLTANDASVGVTLLDTSLAGRYGEKIIFAVIKPEDKGGISFVDEVIVMPTDGTEVTATVTFGSSLEDSSMVAVYRVPFCLSEEGASLVSTELENDGDAIFSNIVMRDSVEKEWGNSVCSKVTVFEQA